MDKPRFGVARNKKIKRTIVAILFLIAATAATYGLSRLKPAAPSVERSTLWPDKVKRGPMLRDIHGTGTLVPEDFRWVPTSHSGLVEKIHVRIGDKVTPSTILAELSNADMEQMVIDASIQLRVAQSDLLSTRANHESNQLNQRAQIANAEAQAERAKIQAEADAELAKDGLKSQIDVRLSKLTFDSLNEQTQREQERVAINDRAAQAQLAAQEARIEQLRETYELRKRQIDQLKIRAGTSGVLQELPIEIGKQIGAGTTIAKVSEPGRLKAQLKIAETQAKDILMGQVASIDTRNGIVMGRIVHIDPAAVQGTVTVDVQLNGTLPKGARPDLSVDGTIEIERLNNVLYVGRPSFGQADSTVQMFKVLPSGEAIRVPVRIGRVSVNSIEILEGLQEGDEVILSDMSAYDAYDRVRLN